MEQQWRYRRHVRYYETDRMGVVHHSNYLRLIEEARLDWLDHVGLNYNAMEKRGIIIPCVSAKEKFKAYLRYDDLFAVSVQLTVFTGVRMKLRYKIYHENTGEVCYTGETEHYFAQDGDYQPISLKKKAPDLYQRLQALTETDN